MQSQTCLHLSNQFVLFGHQFAGQSQRSTNSERCNPLEVKPLSGRPKFYLSHCAFDQTGLGARISVNQLVHKAPSNATAVIWHVFERLLGCPVGSAGKRLGSVGYNLNIPWNYPPRSNSHHQDYSTFGRESLYSKPFL